MGTKARPKNYKSPLTVGNSVLIRTVTHYYTGKIVGLNPAEVLLTDAAWIADTGRWTSAIEAGTLAEVEPYPDGHVVSVARGALVDACGWNHALPRATK